MIILTGITHFLELTLKKHVVTDFKTINNNEIISQLEIPVERHPMSINVNTDLKSNSEYDHRTRKLYITDGISTKKHSDYDLAVTSLPFVETSQVWCQFFSFLLTHGYLNSL
jgi:hypothetical protein